MTEQADRVACARPDAGECVTMDTDRRRYHLEFGWLDAAQGVRAGVLVDVVAGRITAVGSGPPGPDIIHRPGLTLPGLANAHSHAFHRALRGATQDGPGRGASSRRGRSVAGPGSFWTWREAMYAVAARLTPDSYYRLARATYAEMALAGITCVGEFHYLHHGRDGRPYDDPNAMGRALIAAAHDAGIRITLLDTVYLTSTVDGQELAGPQRRFGDGSVAAWADRVAGLEPLPHARIGAAAHSVRAVPETALAALAALGPAVTGPVHAHLSEQPAENADCQAHYGCTPTELLHRTGLLGPHTTVVHATHLAVADIGRLGASGTAVCLCPTTERDLGDGIGPGRQLADAGSPLCLGSDSQSVIDLFEEARGVELHERLRTRARGHFRTADLLTAATVAGHTSLGWPDAGTISVGARADLVTVDLAGVRTAGVPPASAAVYAATAADVTHVLVDGRDVVVDGRHATIDVAAELRAAVVV
jgi:formiminoglutamate deiminase